MTRRLSSHRLSSLEIVLWLAIVIVLAGGGILARQMVDSRNQVSARHESVVERATSHHLGSTRQDVEDGSEPSWGWRVEHIAEDTAADSRASENSSAEDDANAAGGARPDTSAASAPAAVGSAAPSAATSATRERRRSPVSSRVLWRSQGLCGDDELDPNNPRLRYLREFGQVAAPWEKGLFAYPNAPAEVIEQVRAEIPRLAESVQAFLGLYAAPPTVYVHKDAKALRDYSCVNSSAVAFYDGNMHVSLSGGTRVQEELSKSLAHEYVHHALLSHGIEQPIWFQEGAAMLFAKESWESYRFVDQAIPLETMTRAFAHTAKPESARAFYFQAYAMISLLDELWEFGAGSGTGVIPSSERDLLEALINGSATPETLFVWALKARLGDTPVGQSEPAPLDLIVRYTNNGFRLDPELIQRAARAGATRR